MGERAAAQPAERQDQQLAIGHAAVRALEFGGYGAQHLDRGPGEVGMAARHFQRIGRAGDELRAQREALPATAARAPDRAAP